MFSTFSNQQADTLVSNAVAGDEAALQTLLFDCSESLELQIRLSIAGSKQDAHVTEDIAQETYCQVFQDIGKLRDQTAVGFRNWLARIAENRIVDSLRFERAQRRGGDFAKVENSKIWELLSNHETSPSGRFRRDAVRQILNQALVSLPEDRREALQLHYLEGKTVAETAETMSRSTGSIRRLLEGGRNQLASLLGNQGV